MMTPIFIGGTGRSGTTVLKQALAKHSAITCVPVEIRFIVDPGGLIDLSDTLINKWTPQSADIAVQRFEKLNRQMSGKRRYHRLLQISKWLGLPQEPYSNLNLIQHFSSEQYELAFKQFSNDVAPVRTCGKWAGTEDRSYNSEIVHTGPKKCGDMQKIASDLMNRLFQDGHSKCWIDDTPFSFLRALEIFNLFPDARIIHVYRHPMDVLASHLKRTWAGKDAKAIAQRISDILDFWRNLKSEPSLKKENIWEVALEKITENPSGETSKIIEFLDLDQSYNTTISDTFKTANAHIGRWQHELTDGSIDECLPILEKHIQFLGYK